MKLYLLLRQIDAAYHSQNFILHQISDNHDFSLHLPNFSCYLTIEDDLFSPGIFHIPSTFNHGVITEIGEEVFQKPQLSQLGITEIHFPESIQTIHSYAFHRITDGDIYLSADTAIEKKAIKECMAHIHLRTEKQTMIEQEACYHSWLTLADLQGQLAQDALMGCCIEKLILRKRCKVESTLKYCFIRELTIERARLDAPTYFFLSLAMVPQKVNVQLDSAILWSRVFDEELRQQLQREFYAEYGAKEHFSYDLAEGFSDSQQRRIEKEGYWIYTIDHFTDNMYQIDLDTGRTQYAGINHDLIQTLIDLNHGILLIADIRLDIDLFEQNRQTPSYVRQYRGSLPLDELIIANTTQTYHNAFAFLQPNIIDITAMDVESARFFIQWGCFPFPSALLCRKQQWIKLARVACSIFPQIYQI